MMNRSKLNLLDLRKAFGECHKFSAWAPKFNLGLHAHKGEAEVLTQKDVIPPFFCNFLLFPFPFSIFSPFTSSSFIPFPSGHPPPLTSIVHSVSHNIYPCEPEREIMQWKSVQRYKFGYCFLVRGTQNHFLRSYLILELIWTQKNWIEKKNLKKNIYIIICYRAS